MKIITAIAILGFATLSTMAQATAQNNQTVQMQCRRLVKGQNDFIAPDETWVNGMACKQVAAAPVVVASNVPAAAPATKAPREAEPLGPDVPRDAHLAWIDPSGDYASYLQAAAQKKHVPIQWTTKKQYAGLFVTLSAEYRAGSTWRVIFTGGSGRASALSMTVADAITGAVVFSYTCHKGGNNFIPTGHQGFQSAAECLAKHWADHKPETRKKK